MGMARALPAHRSDRHRHILALAPGILFGHECGHLKAQPTARILLFNRTIRQLNKEAELRQEKCPESAIDRRAWIERDKIPCHKCDVTEMKEKIGRKKIE